MSQVSAAARTPAEAAASRPGVFFGWWIVGGAFVIYFISAGAINAGTVYFKALSAEFGLSRGALSSVFSLGFVIAGLSAPLWGRIADRRGPRSSFLPGVLLTGVLGVLLSRVSSVVSLYVTYILFMISSAGISLVPVSVIISKWFIVKRGRAIGIAYMGEGLGGLVLTPVVGALVAGIGWRYSYVVSGLVVLAVLTPVVLWMKNGPEDVATFPDGIELPPPGRSTVGTGAVASDVGLSVTEGIRTSAFWMVALCWLVSMMPLSAVLLHQVPFLTDLGFSTQSASLAAGAVGGMSILGRVGLGFLSERHPIRLIYALCYVMVGVGIGALWATASCGSLAVIAYVAFFGVGLGGSFALSALLVGELFGVRALGEIFGLLGLAATIGGAVGGTGAGLLFDRAGSYDSVFALALILCLVGMVLILSVKAPARS
jgi:MFS family permease